MAAKKSDAAKTEPNTIEATADAAQPAAPESNDGTASVKPYPLKRVSINEIVEPEIGKLKEWFKANRAKLGEYFAAGGEPLFVCRIWGKVVRTTVGTNTYGDFTRFNGQFNGISGFTGRRYKAPQCLLPKWLEVEVDSIYQETGNTVYFGYDIFLTWKPDTSIGYEFVAEPLMEAKDDLSAIEDQFEELPVSGSKKLLPAPEKTA